MTRILILCTGNSCRSQIAEGFLKKIISGKKINAEVFSAGIEAHGLNPFAVKVMNEIGVSISQQQSKTSDKFLNENFDFVITVCDSAKENCPVFPNAKNKIHKNFSDPAKTTGTEEEILNEFRKVRDEIGKFCKKFMEEILT